MIQTEEHVSKIKCPPHKFFGMFRHDMLDMPNTMPGSYKGAKILEGDGKSVGTIRQWSYVLGDDPNKVLTVKERLEELDDENMRITFRALDGEIMEHYNSFVVKLSVTPTSDGGSLVKWTFEFENKHGDDVPHPTALYVDLFALKSSHFDTHLHKPDDHE